MKQSNVLFTSPFLLQSRAFLYSALLMVTMPFSSSIALAEELEIFGKVGGELLSFTQKPSFSEQKDHYASVMIEPELFYPINSQSEIKAKFFYRYDAQTQSRTHGDVRELMAFYYADEWEISAGVGKVFWGKTESRHLVDVVNQQDWIESLDDEARLGQAMLTGSLIKEWGTLSFWLLPGFREIEFLGKDARPRINPVVDTKSARFQSADKASHVDLALRWTHTFEDLDIGLSYFNGTQRTPYLVPKNVNGDIQLQPIYVQTQQFGIDAQYIQGDWLLKFEGLARNSHKADFSNENTHATVAGIEYTLVGILDTVYDLGLIAEHLYDEQKTLTPFDNDVMIGLRWVVNDAASSEVLLGNIVDVNKGSQAWRLEASTRVGEEWKLEAIASWLSNLDSNDALYQAYKNDDRISLRAYYYF